MWDENDFGKGPNQVVALVDTNYGKHGVSSKTPYSHFSLLKTLEAGFKLPCLNHACDANVNLMSELFQGNDDQHQEYLRQDCRLIMSRLCRPVTRRASLVDKLDIQALQQVHRVL